MRQRLAGEAGAGRLILAERPTPASSAIPTQTARRSGGKPPATNDLDEPRRWSNASTMALAMAVFAIGAKLASRTPGGRLDGMMAALQSSLLNLPARKPATVSRVAV